MIEVGTIIIAVLLGASEVTPIVTKGKINGWLHSVLALAVGFGWVKKESVWDVEVYSGKDINHDGFIGNPNANNAPNN